MEETYGLELEPDFQRSHVWDAEKRSKYVEFILKGGRSSRELHWNSKGWGGSGSPQKLQLVDGLQRLTAVKKFMNNELLVLGYYFKDFTDRLRITHHNFTFNVNDLETRAEVLQWYLDLNDGGVLHTSAELDRVRKLLEKENSNGKKT